MIAADSLKQTLQQQLKKMQPDEVISVRTWKGDRGITIYCTAPQLFRLEEDGFQSIQLDNLSAQAVLKQAKTMARREFPRSNKLRFQHTTKENFNG